MKAIDSKSRSLPVLRPGLEGRAAKLCLVLVLCFTAILLAACETQTTTGNVVKSTVPIRSCSIPGFSCFVEASAPGTVQFNLRNSVNVDLENVAVSLLAPECKVAPNSVSIGRVPGGAQNSVRFNCEPASTTITGTVTVTHSTRTNSEVQTTQGTITIRS